MKHLEKNLSVIQIALAVLEKGRDGELASLFSIAWGFWWRRNQLIHDQKNIAVQQVIDYALSVFKCHLLI